MSGRPRACSTATAWVFMETSSEPWNAPHAYKAMKSAGSDPVSPTSGPAAQ
jgi:hypothetical protein